MNCNEVRDKLSLYLDDELNEKEKKLMDEHLKNCPECSSELRGYRKIIQLLNELPNEEPPEGYCKRLHERLLNVGLNSDSPANTESKASKIVNFSENGKVRRYRWTKYAGIAAALVLILLVYNLNNGSKSSNMAGNEFKMEMAYDAIESPRDGAATTEEYEYSTEQEKLYTEGYDDSELEGEELKAYDAPVDARQIKIVKSGSLYVQTKDYHTFYTDITAKVDALGGYIENNNTEVYQAYDDSELLHGNMKIRIPQESFDEAVSYLEETTDVRNKNISESDLTKEYYEKDNRLKNLEVQEQHLRELFDKATTVEEMLQIENELNRVRTEIDALNISLSDIDDRVSMSTISLEVEEVREANFNLKGEKGIWDRAKEGFINTINSIFRWLENLVVDLISLSPILIPVILIFVVLFIKIKKHWQRKL